MVWEYPIDTVWTHVAVVYHNGKPSLYINGVWKKDGLQSLKQHVYPGTQFPGGYYGSQGDGILDEVRIWSVARTAEQIAANKDGELTGPQTGLVGYWPMNEGTGLVLHDVSGSGRDVDLSSAGYTSASWTNGRYSVASITGSYRYGFNGQEHSTEIGDDDYTAQFWEYDSRIGRRWNVDPKPNESTSNYAVFECNPIINVDIKGDKVKKSKDLEDKKLASHSKAIDMIANTAEGKKILQDYDDGGENGLYKGGAKGKFADNVTLEFGFLDESNVDPRKRAGGQTKIYYLNSKDEWVLFSEKVNTSELNANTQFKITMNVNQFHKTPEGAAYTYGHELTVHALLFLNKTLSVLRNDGAQPFMNQFNKSLTFSNNTDLNKAGYYTEFGSHTIFGLGLNNYYNNVMGQLKVGLTKTQLTNFNTVLSDNNKRAKALATSFTQPPISAFNKPNEYKF